jgi:hypothetical protein
VRKRTGRRLPPAPVPRPVELLEQLDHTPEDHGRRAALPITKAAPGTPPPPDYAGVVGTPRRRQRPAPGSRAHRALALLPRLFCGHFARPANKRPNCERAGETSDPDLDSPIQSSRESVERSPRGGRRTSTWW